jgi:plastocyanin
MRLLSILFAALTLAATSLAVRAAITNIDQSGQTFSERSVALAVGDSLTFNNHDDVTHNINVINDDDDAVDLGLQKPGESLTYKFDKSGRFKIRCSIHPSMKMAANVK